MHPFTLDVHKQSGCDCGGGLRLNAGDRFIYAINNRTGIADEFLPDGDALVTWDDDTYNVVKWSYMWPDTEAGRRRAAFQHAISGVRSMKMPKTSNMTEHHIKKEVRKILIHTNWDFWMPGASIYGRGGTSDFLCVKRPRQFMAIETKYEDEPTQQQLNFLEMIHAAGHYAFLVDETNIKMLHTVLMSAVLSPHLSGYQELVARWRGQ